MTRTIRRACAGFTLTELVVVIIIATVLSAFAISRINTTDFDNEGYANRVAAMLRFAQKLAISQRRNVRVVISGNTLSLCYGTTACGLSVREPPGANAFSYATPSSSITLSGTSFWFDALGQPFNTLGQPSAGGAITVSDGTTPRTITVETGTGYVH